MKIKMSIEDWNQLLIIKEKYKELLEKLDNANFVRNTDLMQDDIDIDYYKSFLEPLYKQ